MDRKKLNAYFESHANNGLLFKLNKDLELKCDKKIIADGFYEIQFVIKNNYETGYYIICHSWDDDFALSMQLPVTEGLNIKNNKETYLELKNQDIEIKNMKKFIQALNLEIKFFLKYNSIIFKNTGWIMKNKLEYVIPYLNKMEKNYNFSLPCKQSNFEKVKSYLLLTDFKITLSLFSYMLLSISYKLLLPNPEKPDIHRLSIDPPYDLFGLCVSGVKSKLTCKNISNIFFNFADRELDRINSISLKQYISSSSPHEKIRNVLGTLCDCPVLILANKKSFKKDSTLVYKAMNILKKSDYFPFPVFVSISPFYRDDIITIDISDCYVTQHYYDLATNNYDALTEFIKDYTKELSTISWEYCKHCYDEVCRALPQDSKTDSNKLGKYRLLLYAYFLFLEYGVKFCNLSKFEQQNDLEEAVKTFKLASLEDVLPADIDSIGKVFASFKNYIEDLFAERLSVKYIYWEDLENRYPHAECYYLDYDKYWEDFNRKYRIDIDKKAFECGLLEHSIIYPQTKTRYDVQRCYHGKKYKSLVILKKELEKISITSSLPVLTRKPVKMVYPEMDDKSNRKK